MKKRVFEKEIMGARDRIEVIQYGTTPSGVKIKNRALQQEIPLHQTGCEAIADYIAKLYMQGYREKIKV